MGSTLRGEVLGTGDADSHDQCEHWSRNDAVDFDGLRQFLHCAFYKGHKTAQ